MRRVHVVWYSEQTSDNLARPRCDNRVSRDGYQFPMQGIGALQGYDAANAIVIISRQRKGFRIVLH